MLEFLELIIGDDGFEVAFFLYERITAASLGNSGFSTVRSSYAHQGTEGAIRSRLSRLDISSSSTFSLPSSSLSLTP